MISHTINFPTSSNTPGFGFGFASTSSIPPAALLSPLSPVSEQRRKRRTSDEDQRYGSKKVRSVSPGPELSEAVRAFTLEGSISVDDALDGQSYSTLLSVIKRLTESHPALRREVIRLIPPMTHSAQLDRIDDLERDLIRNIPQGSRIDYVLSSLQDQIGTYERFVIKLLRADSTEISPFTMTERLTASYLRLICAEPRLGVALKHVWNGLKRAWEVWITCSVTIGMVGSTDISKWGRGLGRLAVMAREAQREGDEAGILDMLNNEFCRRTGFNEMRGGV